jgi:hypothetical protein
MACSVPLVLYDVARALGLPDATVAALLGRAGMLTVEDYLVERSVLLHRSARDPDSDDERDLWDAASGADDL